MYESIEFFEMADVVEEVVIKCDGIGVFGGLRWRRGSGVGGSKKKVNARGVVIWGRDGQCGNVVCRQGDGRSGVRTILLMGQQWPGAATPHTTSNLKKK